MHGECQFIRLINLANLVHSVLVILFEIGHLHLGPCSNTVCETGITTGNQVKTDSNYKDQIRPQKGKEILESTKRPNKNSHPSFGNKRLKTRTEPVIHFSFLVLHNNSLECMVHRHPEITSDLWDDVFESLHQCNYKQYHLGYGPYG